MAGASHRPVPAAPALALVLAACSAAPAGIVIDVYKAQEPGFEKVLERCNALAAGRYSVVASALPREADGQREQLVRRLAAGDEALDVLGLDVTWVPEFAEAGWIREWRGADRAAAVAEVLPGPLATVTWDDGVYAAAANTNVQLLWYRKDLVARPPESWGEMIAMAEALEAAGRPHEIAFTGAQYEGLVVGFNTLLASLGGSLVSEDGRRATVDARTVRALALLRELATSTAASESLSGTHEAEALAQMANGYAAFQLNWPYVYAALRESYPEMAERVGFAPFPAAEAGRPARVTTGGMNYAVSSFSRHPEEAKEAILCLRDAESQKIMALNAGTPPTLAPLYEDPELRAAYPMLDVIREELRSAVPRPKTPFYQNVSTLVAAALSPPSEIDPERVAAELRESIQAALYSRGVLP